MKILIAEDESSIRLQYHIVLQERGHEVISTENGRACIEAYKMALNVRHSESQSGRPPFDLVILDYRMPEVDGLAAAKKILRLSPNQRIMFASAHVAETLKEATKDLRQIVELLQKPFGLDQLVEAVEDFEVYRQLASLNIGVKELKDHNLSLTELVDLLAGVKKLQKMVAPARSR
jgi:two-component system, chemotaxis family, chemotaxis protein CheY